MSAPENHSDLLPRTPPEAHLPAGEFPKLELLSLLAQGGMSAVYLARQTDLDRMAVLKVLPLEVGEDAEAAGRFRTEARALASVRDRGVVEVYDFGCTPGGYLYLLLEYEGGGDLRRWLHESRTVLLPAEVLGIGESIAAGLAAAHRKGIIHGDIKPDNIFVDEEGGIKVGDFGLAGFHGKGTAIYHTPGYTAPEILAGRLTMTPQSDLYALGATLFELILQTLPPEDPASRAARLQELPGPVAEVLAMALQEDPARRPASAQDYRQALQAARLQLTSPPDQAHDGNGPAQPSVRGGNPLALPLPARRRAPWVKHGPVLAGAGIALASMAGWMMLGKADKKPPAPVRRAVPEAPFVEKIASTPASPEANLATPPAPIASAPTLPEPPSPPEAETAPGTFENWLSKDPAKSTAPVQAVAPPVPEPPAAPAKAKAEADGAEDDPASWDPDWKMEALQNPTENAPKFSPDAEAGHKVLVMHPFSPTQPATLTRTLTLPAASAMLLSARVAALAAPRSDWMLQAFADNIPIRPPQAIGDVPGQHFFTIAWDLTPWQGKTVTLRLENASGGAVPWLNEWSCWAWIRVEPQPVFPAGGDTGVKEASRELVEPGFVDLFSAAQLPKWKEAGSGGLAFRNGVATTFTRPGPRHEGLYWYSGRLFSDFVLKGEFKLETPEANSGIWLRFPDPGPDPANASRGGGLEMDLQGYDLGKSGTGTIAGAKPPTSLPLRRDGWNQFEIQAKGSQYAVWLNGQPINQYNEVRNRSGYLGIQHLRSDGEVQFRRVRIKDLSNPAVTTNGRPANMEPTPKRPLGVPAGAVPFGGKWFRYYDDKMLWLIAKKKCEDLKGHLAIIPDEATWEFVKNLAGNRCYWLGATDEKSEGKWRWVDGSPVKFDKWIAGEPSNSGGKQNHLANRPNAGWDDLANDGRSYGGYEVTGFVCEWDSP